MNNNTVREILKTNTVTLTRAEIEAIMNEELEKNVDVMDAELVTLCLEALTGENLTESRGVAEEKTTGTPQAITPIRKNKTIKIILVAAILISLMLLTVSVGADVMDINVSDKILSVYDDFFKVDLNGDVETTDLKTVLFENELEYLVLPQYLYQDCEISGFEVDESGESIQVAFNFKPLYDELKGNAFCRIYKSDYDFGEGKQKVDDAHKPVQGLSVNGIEILVYTNDKNSAIVYSNANIEYKITLTDTVFEKAFKVAKTVQG